MIENAIEQGTGGDAKVDVDGESVRVETTEGTYVAGTQKLPEGWPADVPSYPKARISYSAAVNPATGRPASVVILTTREDMAKVIAYYKDTLGGKGWTMSTMMSAGGTTALTGKKDTRTLSLMVTGGESGQTTITIAIEK